MIDPKFDRLPADAAGDFANIPEGELTDEQRAQMPARRRGLSINETIAASADRSVGARGVGVSGVEVGTGNWIIDDWQGADADFGLEEAEIAKRAYQLWHERGCPHGSPEEDWHGAKQELRHERSQAPKTRAANAGSL